MRIRPGILTILAILFLMPLSGHIWAFTPRVDLDYSNGAAVTINGRTAIKFMASNGNLSAAERANITASRIKQLVPTGNLKYAAAKGDKLQGKVFVGATMICLATAADAKANNTTPLALAEQWANNIKKLVSMPPVTLSTDTLLVPLGENRQVDVGGAATGPIQANSTVPEIAAAAPASDGRYIQVMGNSIGSTQVEVVVDGERALFTVVVKKYAGNAQSTAFAEVTGNPAPSSLLKYSATQAVIRSAIVEPGADIKVDITSGLNSALGQGNKRQIKANVSIKGDGYITYNSQVTVDVANSVIPRDEAEQLFYSNNPERILKYQTLFTAKMESNKPTRLLYHHQNAMGKSARFVVEIVNSGQLPATFRIYRGVSRPMVDTVVVGYIATNDFLKSQETNASVIERIPPRSRLILVSDSLGHHETSSGILQIKQTSGEDAHIKVAALPPETENFAVGAVAPAPDILVFDLSGHVYQNPIKLINTEYVVGQRWAFISIGKQALKSNNEQETLFGNYGVTYDINVKVENPTAETKKINVVFDPTAGLSAGVFIINGEFAVTKYAKPPAEITMATYRLQPGESKMVRIITIPVAGSNYPATIVVRS